uniref:Uncharacterized protein n=1 Tax=Mesocestoides corti TaxID=53468 RepID=A0A5K3FD79_MESCO
METSVTDQTRKRPLVPQSFGYVRRDFVLLGADSNGWTVEENQQRDIEAVHLRPAVLL